LLSNATRAATLGVAVQGFVWGLNSFDQWGVELGKVLASKVRTSMNQKRTKVRLYKLKSVVTRSA
jgi:glucose-6-phosphate isomerase